MTTSNLPKMLKSMVLISQLIHYICLKGVSICRKKESQVFVCFVSKHYNLNKKQKYKNLYSDINYYWRKLIYYGHEYYFHSKVN